MEDGCKLGFFELGAGELGSWGTEELRNWELGNPR
jgi:hypothetical protein